MNEKDALNLLTKHITDYKSLKKILNHSSTVKQIAVSITQNINRKKIYDKKIDINTIKIASLLHDIGRGKCPPKAENNIQHNIEGEKIILEEIKNYNKELKTLEKESSKHQKLVNDIKILKVCRKVCRNHVGVGLTKKEIIQNKINLPPNNYIPRSVEEKIIAYSDKLVDGARIKDINYVLKRWGAWLGISYQKRIIKLHKYIHKLMGDNQKLKIKKSDGLQILNILFF